VVSRPPSVGVVAIAIWLSCIGAGFAIWEQYESTPTQSLGTPQPCPPSDFKSVVVMYAHPHCPCSRAGLTELAGVARECGLDVLFRIVFVIPSGSPPDWERGKNWDLASEFPFAQVSRDVGGAEARRVGATASGLVVAFNQQGDVVYRGGITRARGREGASRGRHSLVAILTGTQRQAEERPVFGCPLFESEREPISR